MITTTTMIKMMMKNGGGGGSAVALFQQIIGGPSLFPLAFLSLFPSLPCTPLPSLLSASPLPFRGVYPPKD